MKNKRLIVLEIFCLMLFIVLLLGGALFINLRGPQELDFSGTIMYFDQVEEKGIVFINKDTKWTLPLQSSSKDGVINLSNACFFGTESKILLERECGKIELLDLITNEITLLYQIENPTAVRHEFSYVDNEHFSIIDGNKLLLVNIESKEEQVLAEDTAVGSTVSWSSDGKVAYYEMFNETSEAKVTDVEKEISEDGEKFNYKVAYQYKLDNNYEDFNKVCKIDINTGEKEVICSGQKPVCSADGRYVAYTLYEMEGRRSGKNIIYEGAPKVHVRDITENKEWKLKKASWDYYFSPGGDMLSVVCDGIGMGIATTLRTWDFKNNKSQIVLEDFPVWNIDWIG